MGLFDFLKLRAAPPPAPPPPRPAGVRFAVERARFFDLDQTHRLETLFATPAAARDEAWTEAFYDAAWYASLATTNPAHFHGPDGMPYARFDMPRPNTSFESQSLGNLARGCIEQNTGAAIFASPDAPDSEPQFVLSMGLLDSLLRYDSPDGDPVDRAESTEGDDLRDYQRDASGALIVTAAHEVLIGTPSAELLPPHTARAIERFMTVIWGIESPRVGLMVDHALRPRRNLVIGRTRASFASDVELADDMRRLLWFLPRYRSVILMPEHWKLADMTRLSELGGR